MEGLNRLQVYQKGQEIAKMVYRQVLPKLPSEEKFNLSSQLRRAATSIPANIAEGFGRYYYQETIRFCYLARGSLMELSSHIDLAAEESFISNEDKLAVDNIMQDVLRLIHGYINYLKKIKRGQNEPGVHSLSEPSPDYIINDREIHDI